MLDKFAKKQEDLKEEPKEDDKESDDEDDEDALESNDDEEEDIDQLVDAFYKVGIFHPLEGDQLVEAFRHWSLDSSQDGPPSSDAADQGEVENSSATSESIEVLPSSKTISNDGPSEMGAIESLVASNNDAKVKFHSAFFHLLITIVVKYWQMSYY